MNGNSIFSRIKLNRQTAASIVALLLIAFSGYLVYSYFTKVGAEDGGVIDLSQISDNSSDVQITDDEIGTEEVQGNGNETAQADETGTTESGQVASTTQEECAKNWTATDYNQGDITENEYEVKCGDTLWEIAEAKYGDGTQWTKIRDANADKIGTLPNGSLALIEVGTVLALP